MSLAGSTDEARLRELWQELLAGAQGGAPPPASPSQASGGPGSQTVGTPASSQTDGTLLLGMQRRRLVKDTMLREMMRCRTTQLLATELRDILNYAPGHAAAP